MRSSASSAPSRNNDAACEILRLLDDICEDRSVHSQPSNNFTGPPIPEGPERRCIIAAHEYALDKARRAAFSAQGRESCARCKWEVTKRNPNTRFCTKCGLCFCSNPCEWSHNNGACNAVLNCFACDSPQTRLRCFKCKIKWYCSMQCYYKMACQFRGLAEDYALLQSPPGMCRRVGENRHHAPYR